MASINNLGAKWKKPTSKKNKFIEMVLLRAAPTMTYT
jgi:hypothetical protein